MSTHPFCKRISNGSNSLSFVFSLGVIKPIKIIHDFIDDPFKVEDFNVTKENGFTEIQANFTELEMTGLRDLKVHKVKLDLGELKINIEMSIPLVRIVGIYSIDG